MRILDVKKVDEKRHDKVTFIRVEPLDLQDTLVTIIAALSDVSWISRFDEEYMQGFNSKGVEIFFPLSTRIVLILKDLDAFCYEDKFHNHFVEVTSDEVAFYNSLQVQHSYRYIFNKVVDFTLVNDMMKRNPALGNINRKRFLMG